MDTILQMDKITRKDKIYKFYTFSKLVPFVLHVLKQMQTFIHVEASFLRIPSSAPMITAFSTIHCAVGTTPYHIQ